ncbi:hypothetical protein JCM6882_005030 [Rhodosporidiobolus microsporus]
MMACTDSKTPTQCARGYYLTGTECVIRTHCPSGTWPELKKATCTACTVVNPDAATCNLQGVATSCVSGKCATSEGKCIGEDEIEGANYCKDGKVTSCGEGVSYCDPNGKTLVCEDGWFIDLNAHKCLKDCGTAGVLTDPFTMCNPCPGTGDYASWSSADQKCVTRPTCGPAKDVFNDDGSYSHTTEATYLDTSTNTCRTCNTGSGSAYACQPWGSPSLCYDSYLYKAYCVKQCYSGTPLADTTDLSSFNIPAEFSQRHSLGKNCAYGF